jgi:hypothetical protein
MAREIVITSVPRGVKLGRTGFQVAMQTAGLRDDLTSLLEKMAGYRHLPSGSGANPVSYFHRHAKTIAGQVHVVGRIVDAGVDFSNRSNKLAHMVVLEQAELGQLGASSPAAMLAAIEGRLATTWPGGPEERHVPFSLAGIPASHPHPCHTWHQMMGDAGWAGVIADRAIRNQPTLLVGPDPSPASCRRMLTLFEEALAVVPPAKRWAVTFDTTTLAAEGILWRGTYAGSPESHGAQPGVLVIDLSRPQPIPGNMLTGDLVKVARTGEGQAAATPRMPTAARVPGGSPAPGAGAATGAADDPYQATDRPAGAPPPPPGKGGVRVRPTRDMGGGSSDGWIVGVAASLLLVILALGGVAMFWGLQIYNQQQAIRKIKHYADSNNKASAPTAEDLRTALSLAPESDGYKSADQCLAFFNESLASPEVKSDRVRDIDHLRDMFNAVIAIKTQPAAGSSPHWRLLVPADFPAKAISLLTIVHAQEFSNFREFHDWAVDCKDLVAIAAQKGASNQTNANLDEKLWDQLVRMTEANKTDGKHRNFKPSKQKFLEKVTTSDLATEKTLIEAVYQSAGPPKEQAATPGPTSPAAGGKPPSQPKPPEPIHDPTRLAEQSFSELQKEIEHFKKNRLTGWPITKEGTELFSIEKRLAENLDAEVVVGTTSGFEPRAEKDGDHAWKIKADAACLVIVDLDGGRVRVRRGDAPDDIWQKNEQNLRFMPIAFRRPKQGPVKNDWIVLSQPTEAKLAGDHTLHDLLCGPNEGVPLPDGFDWSTGVIVSLEERKIEVPNAPLTLNVRRPGSQTLGLDITATANDGNDLTLSEMITWQNDGKNARLEAGPWQERTTRLKEIEEFSGNSDKSRTKLGIVVGKGIGISLEKMAGSRDFVEKRCIAIIEAVLNDCMRDGGNTDSAMKQVLAAWPPNKNGKPAKPDVAAYESLGDWIPRLRTYIVNGKFGRDKLAAYENEMKDKRPEDPGVWSEPKRKANEDDAAFNDRKNKAQKEHVEKKEAMAKWQADCKTFIERAAKDPEQLRAFLSANRQPAEPIDPELAAIHVLLGLDGLIVAKAYGEELEAMLKRVPIGALFKGTASLDWSIDGKPQLKVPVANLVPAAVKPEVK